VEVTRRVDDEDTVAAYEYDGLYRRIEKVVSNSGEGVVPGSDDNGTGIQAGDRHEHYFYAGWQLLETTNHDTGGGDYSYDDADVLGD